MSPREYFTVSRQARYSVTLVLPLLALYEALSTLLSGSAMAGVRNGADVLLRTVFVALGGRQGVTAFGIFLVAILLWVAWRDHRRHPGPIRLRVFGAMLAESLVYAALFGIVVGTLTRVLLTGRLAVLAAQNSVALPLGTQLVVSLGAGVYEELLFRVLLVTGLAKLGSALGWSKPVALAGAIIGSALIFSAFHYVGPLGDRLTIPSFTFRLVAGLLLSGLYAVRGFGITAWTHAVYDVGLALLGTW